MADEGGASFFITNYPNMILLLISQQRAIAGKILKYNNFTIIIDFRQKLSLS
ncbi:MAG: hypothetical protein F6K25_13760 [Okeania sp. SIO2G4]|uniref:hypothetical protein n=1 Tax=unclassified Okeania TaxID=2634635 RepID=UPI0013B8EEFE|nr:MULTISPECIES: hypothetical protein [unclassified Okeania]NEP03502.1 hypothetical protein [Okeania sp. SIO4D6]NEP70999.1 hypothetical protein [Okeania sp. SIO2G5]NEP93826.1 hypothetical protein [Okeania sp. SIO2F5]NEQ91702.1 hypothetical protein [Okeania sp. SIO2G4]